VDSREVAGKSSLPFAPLRPRNTGAFIERVYISKVAVTGKPYDSAEDLTEVNPKFDIQAGQTVTLPAIAYNLDRGQPLLIAVECGIMVPHSEEGVLTWQV
jgi:hypothetical protein